MLTRACKESIPHMIKRGDRTCRILDIHMAVCELTFTLSPPRFHFAHRPSAASSSFFPPLIPARSVPFPSQERAGSWALLWRRSPLPKKTGPQWEAHELGAFWNRTRSGDYGQGLGRRRRLERWGPARSWFGFPANQMQDGQQEPTEDQRRENHDSRCECMCVCVCVCDEREPNTAHD